jgi:hypothetical protein
MKDYPNTIFDLRRKDWKYKGVFFAELDNDEILMTPGYEGLGKPPKGFTAGVMAIIWVDEKERWNCKFRIKFPGGSKHVVTLDPEQGSNVEKLLEKVKLMPMKNTIWYPNESETSHGIVEILEKTDMIESRTKVPV